MNKLYVSQVSSPVSLSLLGSWEHSLRGDTLTPLLKRDREWKGQHRGMWGAWVNLGENKQH